MFPQPALHLVGQAVESASGVSAASIAADSLWGGLSLLDGTAVAFWSPLVMLAGLGHPGVALLWHSAGGGAKTEIVPVWYCGEEHAAATVRYPASSFYLPFKHAFQGIYPSRKAAGADISGSPSPRARF